MTATVTLPVWLFVLILLFAVVTFSSHFLLPSVRWFFRRRMERAVARLNRRLAVPIQPFKLARRHDMIQRLVYAPDVTEEIVAYARANDLREDVAFQTANRYAREIVPSFSTMAYFGFAIRAARALSNTLYEVAPLGTDSEVLSTIDSDATIVFVMNHRSNMDYVLVTYLAGNRSALSYAVGEWAQVWPLSRLIRAMGAYFIRRRSQNPLFRKVLARYVQISSAAGVTQAMFPEGGLSLDGAIAPAKVGLLKYIVTGVDLDKRDVVFVPVALNYDRVFEDRILVNAGKTGVRRFRANNGVVARFVLRHLWLRLRGKTHRYGKAAVRFAEPISLRSRQDKGANVDALAQDLMTRIVSAVPALPVPLIASVLKEKRAWDRDELRTALQQKIDQTVAAGKPVEGSVDDIMQGGLSVLSERDLITQNAQAISVSDGAGDILSYYAASLLSEPNHSKNNAPESQTRSQSELVD
ncbi:MAG: 1-acyl-sn-glycerol-3-phosphate acyltransferase [Rhodobacteraceae bacterium]|nr:1-acyl-sn-glycerol-3-phosphate acyltransferase [Paracoccaceae bacterium]